MTSLLSMFLLLTLSMYLFTELDIRVGFNNCITLSWPSSQFEIQLNKRICKLILMKLLLTRSLHLKILVLQHFSKFQGYLIPVPKWTTSTYSVELILFSFFFMVHSVDWEHKNFYKYIDTESNSGDTFLKTS